jgi:flagellar biosynthesis protein FlhG
MRDFYTSGPDNLEPPLDQADGLRRLFNPSRVRYLAVASNPHVAFASVMLERLSTACALAGRHVLVVDAADSAPQPHELALLDAAAGIETLSEHMSYLAARGLPLRHVDTRGSCASFLQAVTDGAPQADVVLVHASASELSRIFVRRALRPLLLAADHPGSVTHAYAAMKLLAHRNGLMSFDLLLAAAPGSARRERIAEQMAACADTFLGAALRDWAPIDPACDVGDLPDDALMRIVHSQLANETQPMDEATAPWRNPSEAFAGTRLAN